MDTLHKILDSMWKQGISDIDFCKAVGINKSSVTDWKKGKTKSYMRHISKIADVLGVTEDFLLSNENVDSNDLTPNQKAVLQLATQLSNDELKKLLDYAKLLKKAGENDG